MSAAEIIEQIKALPAEERRQVVEFVREEGEDRRTDARLHHVKEPIAAIAERLFERYDPLFRKLAE